MRYTIESRSDYIELVKEFLANETEDFTATTMLVAQWIDVCPYNNRRCREVTSYLNDFGY